MSQKQRKKLLSEKSKEVEVEEKLPWSPPRSAWAPIPALDSSFDSLMSNSPTINSPPTSELSKMKFSDIMADEIQQRDNWSKMKSKPLQLTQIEERAIEELRVFYNAANMFDERISVQRVLSVNVAKPMWIKSHHL